MKKAILTLPLAALIAAGAVYAAPAKPAAKPKAKPAVKPAAAQAAKTDLTAEQVMDRAWEATGGKEASDKIKSLTMSGKLEIKAQGLSGSFVTKAKAPDRFLTIQTIEGIGETAQGFDGKEGWSKDPLNGIRTLTGPEVAPLKLAAKATSNPDWREIYGKVEMLGLRKAGTADAYALRVTPSSSGKPQVQYYDAKTFLLVRQDMQVDGPQGTIPTESYLSDYRTVDGIKLPYVTRQRVAGIVEVLMTTTSIKTNVAIDDAEFAKPTK